MGWRYEIRISGTGGQGVALAGIILAEAAGRWRDKQYVVQTVSYGPEVRGGMSNAELVISDEEVDHPKPIGLDLFIPFTQASADQSQELIKPMGIIIHDPDLVHRPPPGWVATIPLTKLAKQSTGRAQMANIVALGAVSVLTSIVTPEAVKAAIKERASERLREAFLKAARAGRQAADKIRDHLAREESHSPED